LITAKLGGSIRGSVVTDKCSVYESYSESSEYETCLNAAYQGYEKEGCKGDGDSSSTSTFVEATIKNKQIEVRGGDSTRYSGIFQDFGNKEIDFGSWINGLQADPYVVGGNVNEIHAEIRNAALLGEHRLGSSLEDDDILDIASAMKAAFKEYAAVIEQEQEKFDVGECSVDCLEGLLNEELCVCENCKNECCAFSGAVQCTMHYGLFFVLFVFSVCMKI